MMMTVNEVSKLAGVSIRTLQYYDKIGLLHPTGYTDAGYRLYDDADLERLQHILLFRELEFPLKDIKMIVNSPDFDRSKALEQQIELLKLKKEHIENLMNFALGIKLLGVKHMDFKAFGMCAHNGTHIDAPFHFIKGGKTVDSIGLDTFVGMAYVAEYCGIVSGTVAAEILEKAKKQNPEAAMRILIKGDAEVSSEAAKVFADSGILLLGNESQTVGPEAAPMEVHLILLGAGIVLLEGIRLAEVPEGSYFLNAAPLNLSGADGSPCRALLIAAER